MKIIRKPLQILFLTISVFGFWLTYFANKEIISDKPSVVTVETKVIAEKAIAKQTPIEESSIITLVNNERIKAKLKPLKVNNLLNKSAQAKACHMIKNNYWSHVAPDGTYPWKFFTDAGYNYIYAGENLAKDFYSNQAMVDAWMNSPKHKENIINPLYKETGIGKCGNIIVQHFGAK